MPKNIQNKKQNKKKALELFKNIFKNIQTLAKPLFMRVSGLFPGGADGRFAAYKTKKEGQKKG